MQPKAEKCILVGYEENTKAYRLWNNAKHRIVISRDVKFNENDVQITEIPSVQESKTSDSIESNEIDNASDISNISDIGDTNEMQDKTSIITTKMKAKARMAKQLKSNLGSYWDQPTEQEQEQSNVAHALLAASTITDPQTIEEALASPDASKWTKAMNVEYESLVENKTWDLVQIPSNREAIDVRWIFKIKQNADGSTERFKARLVAKGFAQRYGIDYEDTFAPVCKFTSIRTILSIGATLDFEIHQLDVKTAFLNGEIDTEIYIRQPPGFEQDSTSVCKLKKGIYGLKQSPRLWNKRINQFLHDIGFKRCLSDPCIYHHPTDEIFLGIYVDDIIIVASQNHLERIKLSLKTEFKMTDIGSISYILGVSITRNRQSRTIKLQQTRYTQAILDKFRMADSKPMSTPADISTKLIKPTTDKNPDVPYRQAIGSLMYLMIVTRPDIAAALNKVAQFSTNFDQSHWTATKRILRYLKGTIEHGLTIGGQSPNNTIELSGSCDADWAGDLDDRRSTSGYVFLLNDHVISWKTHKQAAVATSSTQAEYQALSEATKEALWLRTCLTELGFKQPTATRIEQDNQSTIAIANNPTNHNRTKHIDIMHHFIREAIERKDIELHYCPTSEIIADAMTKPLSRAKFEGCRNRMGLITHTR